MPRPATSSCRPEDKRSTDTNHDGLAWEAAQPWSHPEPCSRQHMADQRLKRAIGDGSSAHVRYRTPRRATRRRLPMHMPGMILLPKPRVSLDGKRSTCSAFHMGNPRETCGQTWCYHEGVSMTMRAGHRLVVRGRGRAGRHSGLRAFKDGLADGGLPITYREYQASMACLLTASRSLQTARLLGPERKSWNTDTC
jgi:hypothetical protein